MKDTLKYNYIQFLNAFWQVNKTANFSSTAIALYVYLLDINNSCRWLDTFNHNNKAIEASLSITYKTLSKAREKLQEAGLIQFQTKNGSPNVKYQILTTSQTYGKFPKVSTEDWDEINKSRIRVNNSKEAVVDFIDYKEFLKDEKSSNQKDSIYQLYRLKKGSLEKLANVFELFQGAKNNPPSGTIDQIHTHFLNWIQKQESLGKLTEYKNPSFKKTGAI